MVAVKKESEACIHEEDNKKGNKKGNRQEKRNETKKDRE